VLNISVRSRPWFYKIALFFDGNRDAVLGALRDAGPEPSAPRVGVLRPKERAPRPTSFTVRELPDGLLAWALGTS
jgi:hypothetical protein